MPAAGRSLMRQRTRALLRHGLIWGAVGAALAASVSALAQIPPPRPVDPNQRQVYLVRKDQADCTNSDVPNDNSPLVVGNIWVTRLHDGNTSVKIAVTAKPNTKYQFFLKCVLPLGDITTDDEGVASVAWPSRPTSSAPSMGSTCTRRARRPDRSSRARRSRFGSRDRLPPMAPIDRLT